MNPNERENFILSSLKSNRVVDRIRLRRMENRAVEHPFDWEAYRKVLIEFVPRTLPHHIQLNQRWPEWEQLLKFLTRSGRPRRILEIGTGKGGSTYFLTRLAAEGSLVVTVDADPLAKKAVALFAKEPGQQIHSVIGSSHDQRTVNKVAALLGATPVDVLYIDGDHSYEGVKKDFELYKQFCGKQTTICFHDIIPDYGTTKGIQTEAWTGEVYKFWAELKQDYEYLEFVESADQDGFGIGVLLPRS